MASLLLMHGSTSNKLNAMFHAQLLNYNTARVMFYQLLCQVPSEL